MEYNNAINTDGVKRRSFVAPLYTAGYGEREMISIMYVIWVTYES